MTIPRAPFGATGHQSTRTLFGAAALGSVGQEDADRTLELLLQHGINHIDTAASYGESELRIGPWMAAHRKQIFRGHQNRRAHLPGRARPDPPFVGAATCRSGRPDAAAQPGRAR